jgi:rfaE bifunctional protein nucleotidyltransferase chain/domain
MKTVLVGGCFDVLHFGHIQFLQQAKKLGDTLIVALEADENVTKRKGPLRPIHTQQQRKEMLLALSCVDTVVELPIMNRDDQYKQLVEDLSPSIIAVTEGDPYKEHKQTQADQVRAVLVEIKKIHTPSTSQLAKLIGLE